ncbi:mip transporter protein [Rutstroemia sp. NJR-2017a WRK4]|nr:mip transporter protein [Rutstroemia sp. NJR-2017a WRK4]
MAESHDQEQGSSRQDQPQKDAPPSAPPNYRNESTNTQTNTKPAQSRRPTAQPRPSRRSKRASARPNYQTLDSTATSATRPDYSLAGNAPMEHREPRFIEEEYYDFNPTYQKPKDAPLWGLAKPLPRVVRPGMRRGRNGRNAGVVEDKGAEHAQPGDAEAIPQVGMILSQEEGEGKKPKQSAKGSRSREERGYGRPERPARGQSNRSMARKDSGSRKFDRNGTPLDERNNPLEDWRSPFDDGGDLGERRTTLSDVAESSPRPSNITSNSRVTTQSDNLQEPQDSHELDLEAGDKLEDDDWSLNTEEVEEHIREEKDNFNQWAEIRAKFREPLAECLATMVAVLIGICTNLADQTSNETKGSYLATNWAWGLGITIGIYIAGGISGGHLNPAVSIMLYIFRGFPARKAFVYILAQILGAFFAGLIAYGIYQDAIASYNVAGGKLATGTAVNLATGGTGPSFYTQPASFTRPVSGFFNEFVATAILSCAILALGDDSNAPPGAGMHALIVGLLVTVLTMAFGYNTGACLNPARDFGPRLATAAVGYGRQVFTVAHAWWIYGAWAATVSGALVGAFFYDVVIFVGGESPINYPPVRRRQARQKAKERTWRRWLGFKTGVEGGGRRLKGDFRKEG